MSLSFIDKHIQFQYQTEINSIFPGQSIVVAYLALKPLYLSRCHLELHLHCLSKSVMSGGLYTTLL